MGEGTLVTSWPRLFEVRDPATLSRPQRGMVTTHRPTCPNWSLISLFSLGIHVPCHANKGWMMDPFVWGTWTGPHYTVQLLHSTLTRPTNAIVTRHCVVVK